MAPQALLSAAPVPDPKARRNRILLAGDAPSPVHPPAGCSLHHRCCERRAVCSRHLPEIREATTSRFVACHNR